jgi:hypothetical protein
MERVVRASDDDLDVEGGAILNRPIIIVEALDEGGRFRLQLNEVDPSMDSPGIFGVILSDLVDHIAAAYQQSTGVDQRFAQHDIMKVLLDENRAKDKDPNRAVARGKTFTPLRS